MGILEALSYGLPCIVTYGTTFGEYVNDNNCGIGIKFDCKELFGAIRKMFENKRFRDECAKNTVVIEQNYNWDHVAKKCLACYEELLCYSI